MARKPRVHLPGGVYHVILRGNGGQRIFFEEGDYARLLSLIEEGIGRFGHRVHGYCCMPNHVHLVVQVGERPLSRPMQNLAFRYARWVNWRRQRIGHLFQGRYKAILVDRDSYLLELVRYIHLNPVRARMVEDPAEYPWSSHRAYLGRAEVPWLTTNWVLGQFSNYRGWARRRYRQFLGEAVGEGRCELFHRGERDSRVLGDDAFLQTVLQAAGERLGAAPTLEQVVALVCDEYGIGEEAMAAPGQERHLSEARAAVGLVVREWGGSTLAEVGRRFGRHGGSISSAVGRLSQRAATDRQIAARLDRLRAAIERLADGAGTLPAGLRDGSRTLTR